MRALDITVRPPRVEERPEQSVEAAVARRAVWMKLLMKWHWISSALSLSCMLFFAATGITLNNAEIFENAAPSVTQRAAQLPASVMTALAEADKDPAHVLPPELKAWLKQHWSVNVAAQTVEWRSDEIFVDLKRPGVDAWVSIDPRTGAVQHEVDDRGWVAFFNDLHKGKSTGKAWSWFVTLFGVFCLVFCLTGLALLQLHARSNWKIWPVTLLGLLLPVLLLLLHVA